MGIFYYGNWEKGKLVFDEVRAKSRFILWNELFNIGQVSRRKLRLIKDTQKGKE